MDLSARRHHSPGGPWHQSRLNQPPMNVLPTAEDNPPVRPPTGPPTTEAATRPSQVRFDAVSRTDPLAEPLRSNRRLVGRSADLHVLQSFLADAAGSGAAMILSGEPGIGKSVLLDAAVEAAVTDGTLVLRTTGSEFRAETSWSTVSRLLAPLTAGCDALHAAHRAALLPVLNSETTGAVDRLVLYNAVLALLQQVSAERPLLLVVDDVQWTDQATASLLSFVARRLSGTRTGLLMALRPGVQGSMFIAGLPARTLAPLADADADTLVRAHFPALSPWTVRRVLAEARGNPLALLELPTALGEGQRDGAQSLPATLPLSRRLRTVFGSRVEHLPPATRRLLLLAALEGHGDLTTLLRATGDAADLADLVPAEKADLVAVDHDGRRLAFRHPLVSSTVVECSTPADRIAAHRRLAHVLEAEPERRIWHLAATTRGPDEPIAQELEKMAHRSIRRGDAAGALTGLLRAADLGADGAVRSRRLDEAAYLAASVTGELQRAATLLVEARRGDGNVRGSLRAAVAAAYLLLNGDGDVTMAHQLLVGAILDGRADADEHDLAEALHVLLIVCLNGARPELWPPFHDALNRLPSGPPALLQTMIDVLAGYAGLTGSGIDALDTAIEELSRETNPLRIQRVATTALFLDRARRCREPMWRLVSDGRAGGAVTSAITALTVLALDDVLTGDWDEATRLADEGLQLCAIHGYALQRWPFCLVQATLAAARGDEDRCRELVAELDRWATSHTVGTVHHYARYADARSALASGDAERGFQALALITPPGVLPFGVPIALWTVMDLVEAAMATDRPEQARAHVKAMRRCGLARLSSRLAMLSTAAEAMVAPEADAAGLYAAALTDPATDRWPFDRARVQLAYGQHLRLTRQPEAARAQLDAALATFQRLKARPWAARAAVALRAAGERPPPTDPANLTAQERRIAHLASTGLTNREIGRLLLLSHRTVGSHLHRIFEKLGITTRVALRDALAALPNGDADSR
jgi:DNA-binding CsgD family transcriptional regulator